MSSSEVLYDTSSSTSSIESLEELENICPYCSERLTSTELQYHLDTCRLYREVSNRNNSMRSRLFSALRDSLTLYRPWQGEEQSEDWSSSVYSSEESLRSTPEFSPSKEETSIKVSNISCPVCFECFNSCSLKPLILPKCGHTVCSKCLKHIIKASSIVKCPVCRKNNPTDISRLPINYALLEYSEIKEEAQVCGIHKLEIVGFCLTDSEVLCGACVMEHADHECYSLDDPRVVEIADERKKGLIEEEAQLIMLQDTWTKAQDDMEKMTKTINCLANTHISQFRQTETKIIDEVKAGKKACLNELQQLSYREEIKEIESSINGTLICIQQEIAKIKAKKEKFEEMDVYEKLSKPKVLNEATDIKIPSLGPLYKIVLKLQAEVNYKLAIKKHHINL